MLPANDLGHRFDNFEGERRQRQRQVAVVLRALLRERPLALVVVDLAPLHPADFLPPVAEQRQQFDNLPNSPSPLAFQIATSSVLSSTRSRGSDEPGWFVPTTGLASHKPSPIAHTNRLERAERAREAVTMPELRLMAVIRAATSARVMSPIAVLNNGPK